MTAASPVSSPLGGGAALLVSDPLVDCAACSTFTGWTDAAAGSGAVLVDAAGGARLTVDGAGSASLTAPSTVTDGAWDVVLAWSADVRGVGTVRIFALTLTVGSEALSLYLDRGRTLDELWLDVGAAPSALLDTSPRTSASRPDGAARLRVFRREGRLQLWYNERLVLGTAPVEGPPGIGAARVGGGAQWLAGAGTWSLETSTAEAGARCVLTAAWTRLPLVVVGANVATGYVFLRGERAIVQTPPATQPGTVDRVLVGCAGTDTESDAVAYEVTDEAPVWKGVVLGSV